MCILVRRRITLMRPRFGAVESEMKSLNNTNEENMSVGLVCNAHQRLRLRVRHVAIKLLTAGEVCPA